MRFEQELGVLFRRILPLAEFINAFAEKLNPPIWYDSGESHYGYRFGSPDVRHFCLLKGTRAVSGLNACVILSAQGFTQEIAVIVRTIVECKASINFVLADADSGSISKLANDHVSKFFADYKRNSPADFQRPHIKQAELHRHAAASLKRATDKLGTSGQFDGFDPAVAYSNIYLNFSNYVHARYPEVMDMYGGIPPMFHMYGMRKTSKDAESIEIISTIIQSVSTTLQLVDKVFDLKIMKYE